MKTTFTIIIVFTLALYGAAFLALSVPNDEYYPPAEPLQPFEVVDQTGYLNYRSDMNMRSRLGYSCEGFSEIISYETASEDDWEKFRARRQQAALGCIAARYEAFIKWCNTFPERDKEWEEKRDCAEAKRNINFIP